MKIPTHNETISGPIAALAKDFRATHGALLEPHELAKLDLAITEFTTLGTIDPNISRWIEATSRRIEAARLKANRPTPMDTHAKIRKLEALRDGATTPAERQAAEDAIERVKS